MQRHINKAFMYPAMGQTHVPDAILALKTVSNWVYVTKDEVRKIIAHKRSPR